jgi:parallel beta-helix repeat protein
MKNQIKHSLVALALLALSTLNSQFSTVFAQGNLPPPPGPVAPTMKTLSQVEPRTPIGAVPSTPIVSLPYAITAPGSYYLTSSLTGVSGSDGITISANDVTLDLSGFTLLGVAGSGNGIHVTSGVTNVSAGSSNLVVRNGVLDSWGSAGVNAGSAFNAQFHNLRLFSNSFGLEAGNNCTVLDCTASDNTSIGIYVQNGCAVKDCLASDNYTGISTANDCTVLWCTANNNGSVGIGTGWNSTVKDSTAGNNGGDGIQAGPNTTVQSCTAAGNDYAGIEINYDGLITGNNCCDNTYGIFIDVGYSLIDGNNVRGNSDYAIYPQNANHGNVISRNSGGGSSSQYFGYGTNPDYAPFQSISTATSPWANF